MTKNSNDKHPEANRIEFNLSLPPAQALSFLLLLHEAILMKENHWGKDLIPELLNDHKKIFLQLSQQVDKSLNEMLGESIFEAEYAMPPSLKKFFHKYTL